MDSRPVPVNYVVGQSNVTIPYEQQPRPYHTKVARLVVERLSEGTLLDYGCGVGNTAAEIARMGGRFDVTLVDPDQECLRRAVDRLPRAQSRQLDGAGFPEDLGSFDVVLLSHVLQYVPEPLTLLRQLADSVRPGGFLVIATPNPVTPTKVLHHLRRHRYSEGMYAWDRHALTTLLERGLGARVTDVTTDYLPLPGASRSKFVTQMGKKLVRVAPMLGFSIIEVVEPGMEPGART